MNELIYDIKNLNCKYASNLNPVLHIENLCIEKGKKTFFIGASGVGKSTILETLGLMNNTIFSPEKETKFLFLDQYNNAIDLTTIWTEKEKIISSFRNVHFSFIFQNTNLFKTISAFDNIAISAILQGKSRSEAYFLTHKIIEEILPNVELNKPITELSGGQRQRIAFARAVVTDYTVLFADEPTGNLDMANARKLMEVLIKNIENKSTIIVTHDIDLTVDFADKIVLIRKVDVGGVTIGIIDSDSIYNRTKDHNWLHKDMIYQSDDLKTELKNNIINQTNL